MLQYAQDVHIDEILKRTSLLMATFDSNISAHGIVDSADPRTAVAGGSRAFSVGLDVDVPTTLRVQPGTAVFPSGEIIVIDSAITQLSLADSTPTIRNIVFLQFSEEEIDPVLTRSQTLTNSLVSFLSDPSSYVRVLTKNDYDALSNTEKALTIPLALVTVQNVAAETGTTTRINVDLTRTSFTLNRPWFSVVDAEHRSHLGTGTITSTNVHGLSINDLSAANGLTFLQVALDHGMIISKDQGIAGVPGTICTESIPPSSILTDTGGTVTGINNMRYFRLSRVPTQVLRIALPLAAQGQITITIGVGNVINEGCTFILNDGTNPAVTFVFDAGNVGVVETNTLRKIAILGSEDTSTMRSKVRDAINNAPVLKITATNHISLPGVLNLKNDDTGKHGNQLILETVGDSVANTAFVATGMSGGLIHELAPIWVPGSNIVGISSEDEYVIKGLELVGLIVYSAVVEAGEPDLGTVNPTFKVLQAATSEVMVSGGLFLPTINTQELTFENAGPIPANYTTYIDEVGTLQMFPQTIFCFKKLNDIGTALQTFDFPMIGPAKLKVFLADASAGPSLNVQVQITGTDTNGSVITETIAFASSWAETAPGGASENENQSIITENIFDSASNLIISVRTGDGPNTNIMVQAMVDPINTSALSDVLPVAEIFWNGFQVPSTAVRDIRPINTSLVLPDYMSIAAAAPVTAQVAASQVSGVLYQYWAEDFNKPRYVTTEITDTSEASDGVGEGSTRLTKLTKGLGKNDYYISRPVPVKPYDGTATSLRFIPIQPGKYFKLKARYYDQNSDIWSPWFNSTGLNPFIAPGYSIVMSTTGLLKWQMVVTGPVEGMYVILNTSLGTTKPVTFVSDSGAWPNGVFM
jgi:hypothetical protein